MDLLANYDDDTTEDNSMTASPKQASATNQASAVLENEWLSFEQMIAPGGVTGSSGPVDKNSYLVDGVVAYPGMKKPSTASSSATSNIEPVVQSSESDSIEDGSDNNDCDGEDATGLTKSAAADDDDAFFRLRKVSRKLICSRDDIFKSM